MVEQTQTVDERPDDMIDLPSEIERWPFLNDLRGGCRDLLVALYRDSDKAARDAQGDHRIWVVVAAVSATAAVCLAILQLLPVPKWILLFVELSELVAVITALFSFDKGQQTRQTWLTERHKAERCRLLKFAAMIHPAQWTLGGHASGECPPDLSCEIDIVKRMKFPDVEEWLKNDNVPSPPGRTLPRDLKQLTELRDYYRQKRLRGQSKYFKEQTERDVRWDESWQNLPYVLFKLTVVLVLVHIAIKMMILAITWTNWSTAVSWISGVRVVGWINWSKALGWVNWLNSHAKFLHAAEIRLDILIVFAAFFPVFGSGIRTWNAAREGTRNISRFRAKWIALDNIDHRITLGEIEETAQAESVLRDLWCAEQIMESEHREWLRLMGGADWRG